jgi:hypothetical protein
MVRHKPVEIPGITWQGKGVEDVELLSELPPDLMSILIQRNGFILHEGALHVRGASIVPEWHSLRTAWRGPKAFHILYEDVRPSDIPFAQEQLGDQFLIREGKVVRLFAETGETEPLASSLDDFFARLSSDIEGFLNVGLSHKMEPGRLLWAFPPFCFEESGAGASLAPLPASEVILLHADLAKQIRDVPDGGEVEFKLTD